MKWAMLAFLILLMCLTGQAQTDTVPEWLDTIPPVVHVLPDKRFQNEMFHITLGINEPGRLYMGFTAEDSLKPYTKPYTILTPGSYTVYYYAEDDMGNRSALDSATYVFDKTPPVLTVDPKQGMFRHEVLLEVRANEPCDFFMHTDKKPIDINHTPGTGSGTGRNANGEQHHLVKVDTFRISENFEGYISARDASGNIRTQGPFTYIIDTTDFSVAIDPKPGVYNDPDVSVRFIAPPQLSVFYSFDPTAPPKWFTKYDGAVDLPHGVSLLRYFWVNSYGQESDIEKATFVVDTVAPRIRFQHIRGKTVDSLLLLSSEPAQIRYSRQPKAPLGSEQTYQGPIAIDRRIRGYVKAMARDSAGNMSELFVWQHRYDTLPPRVWPLRKSGKYNSPFALRFGMSESVKVFYTLNGSAPDRQSALYQDSIQISRNGLTVVKFFAVDLAGNSSEPDSCYYYLDLTPPVVKARVEGNLRKNLFHVTLRPSEPSTIYYEIGGSEPTIRSPRYSKPIAVRQGQTLIYFAQDSAGNNSEMYRLDELKSPMVKISPEGGVFNRRINITFETNGPSRIYYRIPPDTVYRICHDSLLLQQEGLQTVEYYSENRQGIKSTVRRNEYLIDWTAPRVNISMRKGTDDSVYVFFESNESATIYYTLDGSSPLFSSSTRVAGNKFLMSGDRISVKRNAETKLAFYAEDIAGNQSMLSVIDVAKPRVIPNLPAGSDKVYDRILSVRLNTYDQNSQIYYERHGKSPTMDSPLYSSPITLMRSDTIIAFVMDVIGYLGDPDTFVYNIDLPPTPQFTAQKDTIQAGIPIRFDASNTLDHETETKDLTFLWDFDSDGVIDSKRRGEPCVEHVYDIPGRHTVSLRVTDAADRSAQISRYIYVVEECPQGMMFVPRSQGRSFCMDVYEWPNRKGQRPEKNISWVEARMHCHDAGKRLCTAEEWEFACRGGKLHAYPYGKEYEEGKCADTGKRVFPSGEHSDCGEGFGLQDMVGNLWEWVETKKDAYPLMMGGAYTDADLAHCKTSAVGHALESDNKTGFRCCK